MNVTSLREGHVGLWTTLVIDDDVDTSSDLLVDLEFEACLLLYLEYSTLVTIMYSIVSNAHGQCCKNEGQFEYEPP